MATAIISKKKPLLPNHLSKSPPRALLAASAPTVDATSPKPSWPRSKNSSAHTTKAKRDPKFQARLDELLHTYAGRPTPLFFAQRLTKKLGGAKIYLKREDLLHTGAHKINNCIGQALLVERMGKHRVIAETGAGQHGVATATVCALLRLRVRRLHGHRRHAPPGAQRLPHAPARRRSPRRRLRLAHAERRHQRSHARLGHQRPHHALPARQRPGRASLSDHGARLPPRHRTTKRARRF